MTKIIATALEAVGGDREITGTGWTMGEALMMSAATQLDARRFGDDGLVESILARYGEDTGALYPEASELAAVGADLFALNNAAVNGLDMELFGRACKAGLDVAAFTESLNGELDNSEHNGNLELFLEAHDEHTECPDAGMRAGAAALMRLDGAEVDWLN